MKYFGENLRTLRKKASLSQDQIAVNVGVNRTNWSDYELSRSEPKLETIVRIIEYFGVTFEQLCQPNASLIDFLEQQENNSESKPKSKPNSKPNTSKNGHFAEPEAEYHRSDKAEIIEIQRETINTQKMLIETLSAQLARATEDLSVKKEV